MFLTNLDVDLLQSVVSKCVGQTEAGVTLMRAGVCGVNQRLVTLEAAKLQLSVNCWYQNTARRIDGTEHVFTRAASTVLSI